MNAVMRLRYLVLALLLCFPLCAWPAAFDKEPEVKVRVVMRETTDHKNLVLYRRARPLTIADFRGRPDEASRGVGATYSGILMEIEGSQRDRVLDVTVYLTVYCDQQKSWMKKAGRNERVLAHEQRHFDLTALKACDLARAIGAAQFSTDNVKEKLRQLHREQTQQLETLQKQYDAETAHGTLEDKQLNWNRNIAAGLDDSDCL